MSTTAEQRDLMMECQVLQEREIVKHTITISPSEGRTITRTFVLYVTTAPSMYDYDVIVVQEQDGIRWLLIDEERANYQVLRYRSGMFPAVFSRDMTPDGIASLLWRRLFAA